MITLEIIGDSPEARKFITFARTLPFVREKGVKRAAEERTPPCQYTTAEEFRSAVFEGMEACRQGDVISAEDLEKEMNSWR